MCHEMTSHGRSYVSIEESHISFDGNADNFANFQISGFSIQVGFFLQFYSSE